MSTKKFSLTLIFSIILTLGLSISLGSLLAAWTSPSSAPPDGNVAAPLNTSVIGQAKQGGLILNTAGGTNALIIQSGKVGIGTTDPQVALDVSGSISVTGNIIAAAPTADNHLTTKGYVDAASGGGCFDQYHYIWCGTHQGEKCAKVGTMDYKCVGDFCTKAGIANDLDGDGVTGATDCDDNDPTIVAAADGTCDGDADGKIDHTAYTASPKPALADCADNNPSSYICADDGTVCSSGGDCSSGNCIDGYCCDTTCGSSCSACDVSGSIGTCINVPDDTDPHYDCSATSCTSYIYGGVNPTCYRYASNTSHNGMCDGSGACYTTVADSCANQGATSLTCGSTGCWKACVANSPSSSYDSYYEVCYTDSQKHSCVGNLTCDATGTCKLAPSAACTADNQCGSGYLCGVDNDGDRRLTSATTGTCKLGINHTDCDDNCSTCYPGSTAYTESPDGLDQDCDGTVDDTTKDYCSGNRCGTYFFPESGAACTARCAAVCPGYPAHSTSGSWYVWGPELSTTCDSYTWYKYRCQSSAYSSPGPCEGVGGGEYMGRPAMCSCYKGPYYH